LGELIERLLGGAVLAQQAHVKVPVVRRPLGLAVTRCRGPGARQIVEAVPMNSSGAADEELGRARQPEGLYFLRTERRDADFRHPDRARCDGAYFFNLRRPLVNRPVVPV